MKIYILVITILLSISSVFAQKPIIDLDHDISAITVYLNNAEINRTATTDIPVGKSTLVFKGISTKIMEKGLKVKVSNDVKVYAIDIEKNKVIWEENKLPEDFEKQETTLAAEKRLLNIELNTLKREWEFLDKNMKINNDNDPDFSQLDKGYDYFREKTKAIQTKIYDTKNSLKEVDEKKADLNILQQKSRQKTKKTTTSISVTVSSNKATTADIELRYHVDNAVWKPYYSLRAGSQNESITFDYQAQIYNDTGNDWIDKPLTLAIMSTSDDVSKPQLDPWVLNDYNSYNRNREGQLNKAKGRYKDQKKEVNTTFDVLQIDDLSTRFEIKDLHSIPADARPHLIDVTSYHKPASYYTLAIPKVREGAFLIARIGNWQNTGLMDGPINLYHKDTYQGTSQLKINQQINDTLDISLGNENAYTITRRKVSGISKKKLIGFLIKEIMTYEIIVKNNKNEAGSIEIRDQLPISTDKDMEVKALETSNAQLDELSGQLTWKINLKPNESKKIRLKFSVKYPKNKQGSVNYNKKQIITPRYF